MHIDEWFSKHAGDHSPQDMFVGVDEQHKSITRCFPASELFPKFIDKELVGRAVQAPRVDVREVLGVDSLRSGLFGCTWAISYNDASSVSRINIK